MNSVTDTSFLSTIELQDKLTNDEQLHLKDTLFYLQQHKDDSIPSLDFHTKKKFLYCLEFVHDNHNHYPKRYSEFLSIVRQYFHPIHYHSNTIGSYFNTFTLQIGNIPHSFSIHEYENNNKEYENNNKEYENNNKEYENNNKGYENKNVTSLNNFLLLLIIVLIIFVFMLFIY
jgi:hypothetical protein